MGAAVASRGCERHVEYDKCPCIKGQGFVDMASTALSVLVPVFLDEGILAIPESPCSKLCSRRTPEPLQMEGDVT